MIKETSAGVVVFRIEQSKVLYLLLNYPTGHWDFVKGKTEKGESLGETVVREAKEETGISDIMFVDGFEEWVRYRFQYEGELVNKKVLYFLGQTNTSDIVLSFEHLDYAWVEYHEALKKITYKNSRNVLAKSRKWLKRFPSVLESGEISGHRLPNRRR